MSEKLRLLWVGLCAGIAVFATPRAAMATILTFEGESAGYVTPLTTYGGLSWSSFYALNNSPTLDGYHGGYVEGAVSGTTVAFNDQAGASSDITSPTPFTFNSAYFTGAFNDGLNVTIEGWRSGTLLDTASFTVDAISPTFRTFDFVGIDNLRVYSSGGTRSDSATYGGYGDDFVMDNFKFTPDITPIPEPSSLLCMAVSGFIMGGLWWKRRTRATPMVGALTSSR